MDDKQARSVFVGNIPHGTTEEQMKDIFSVVGTVLSFRIVYDRETGNPKGYGFAEYMDTDTAQSAIRNLSGFEFGGRTLRVDRASSQADELKVAQQQQQHNQLGQMHGGPVKVENFYGPPTDPRRAPEVISEVVASLPPEQMFELMKQLKQCVQNNPSQARQMLLHNPQLAYALLQAQVVMRIVEPQVALALLYRQDPTQVAPLQVPSTMQAVQMQQPVQMPDHPSPPFARGSAFPPPPPPPNATHMQMNSQTPLLPMQQSSGTPSMMFPPPPGFSAGQPRAQMQTVASSQAIGGLDSERASLLMQVIQLSEEQIASLSPDQRQNIMLLKDQLSNTCQLPPSMGPSMHM